MNENNNYQVEVTGGAEMTQTLSAYITKVFGTMFVGLLMTAITAFYFLSSGLIFTLGSALYFFLIAEVLLVVWMSARVNKFKYGTLLTMFFFYSILNGITLSTIFFVYDIGFIATAFVTTALTFGVMAVYGAVTKNDLTRIGSLCIMVLIGGLIMFAFNWFMKSSQLDYILSVVMLVVFVALVAFDTQKLKSYYYGTNGDIELQKKTGVMGALSLYLDFINIFLYILRIFGRKK